jgi:hypothetical protein
MTLAHITGGQYVPMVDANRLANMIIGGVREELSLDRLMHSARVDISREMRKSASDGVDDGETASRLQKLFSKKKMNVSRMKNEAGVPSKQAEECYSKCVDMSDMQKQYQKTEPVSNTKTADMDYALEEEKPLSLEQAKRVVQKAKNWDYSSVTDEQNEQSNRVKCKHGGNCYDHSTYHRARFSHPESDDLTIRSKHETKRNDHTNRHQDENNSSHTPCKHGANCYDRSDYHRGKYSHPGNDDNRIQCRHGAKCHDQTEYHRAKYSHPNPSN